MNEPKRWVTKAAAVERAWALFGAGDLARAETLARQIHRAEPRDARVNHLLAVVCYQQGQLREALGFAEQAVALAPRSAALHSNLAQFLRLNGEPERAEKAVQAALALDPGNAAALNNLGILLFDRGDYAEAVGRYEQALAIQPVFAEAACNLGNALRRLGRPEEALAAYARSLADRPDYPEALLCEALALAELERFEEAEARLRGLIARHPQQAAAHAALGDLLLVLGREEEGWREAEWVLANPAARPKRLPGRPWLGEPLQGRSLLVFADPSLSVTLGLMRHLPLLDEAGAAQRTLLVPPGLERLAAASLKGWTVVRRLPGSFDCDFHLGIRSLPIRRPPAAGPGPGGFLLRVDGKTRQFWERQVPDTARPAVAIAWRETEKGAQTPGGSGLPTEAVRPLLEVEGVRFLGVQLDVRRGEIDAPAGRLTDLSPEIDDLSDLAGALMRARLVISADLPTAHLAAALGRPVWVLLPRQPRWPWGLRGRETPWHPSARLFRLGATEDWPALTRRVAAELAAFAG